MHAGRQPIVRLDDPGGVSRAIRLASNGQDIVLFFAYGNDRLTAAGPLAVSRAQNVGVWWTLMLTLNRASCAASLSACPCAFGGIEVDGPWDRPRDRRDTRPAHAARRQLLRVRVYWLARFYEAGVNVFQCDLDVGWIANPFPLFRAIPDASVLAQTDGSLVNAGVIYFRHGTSILADAVTLWLLNEWSNRLMGLGGDEQTTLHDVLTTMASESIYLSEQLVTHNHKSVVIASWIRRNRLMKGLGKSGHQAPGSARRAGGIGDLRPKRLAAHNAGKAHACDVRVTPWFLWHLSVPTNITGAAYADAVSRVFAECEEDRLRPHGEATQERAQEVRAMAMLREQAAVRCGSSPQARGCELVAAPEQPAASSCHVGVPEWDWRPGVSLHLALPATRPLQSIQLASLPAGLFASFQMFSHLMRTSRCDNSTVSLPCATPVHLVHLSSYPSKNLRAAVLDLIDAQLGAARLTTPMPDAEPRKAANDPPPTWVWLEPQSWDLWPKAMLAGIASKAVLAVALAIAKRTGAKMVLPQLPSVAVRALSENIAGHSSRLPYFTDNMAVGCGPSQRFVWLPWGLNSCVDERGNQIFSEKLVASLIYRHGRLVADVDRLRPSLPAAASSRRIEVKIEVFPNGSVQWARGGPPRLRGRRNASNSWHVRVGPAANAWSTTSSAVEGRSTMSGQASWMCTVAWAVEGLTRKRRFVF